MPLLDDNLYIFLPIKKKGLETQSDLRYKKDTRV